ncbi:hypothetical protein IW261DRAFT_1517100 [Armillaria novae-zelandiae]|uniref:F-box domain-containing protein n=1 Tax=Armillaria novae-zelandiae TaxID=153914 RepID=A0AA39U7R1_9AGAR|nr:hypothetical protein IW261DRAFT_1517100 [Armillaria novae-zelandiae]
MLVTRGPPPPPAKPCPQCGFYPSMTDVLGSVPSSRIDYLLSCNDPPTDYERSEFENIVANGRRHIRSIDRRLSQIEKLMHDLTVEKDIIQKRMKASKKLMNPVRKVPYDVLEHIFCFAVDEDVMNTTITSCSDGLDVQHARWAITHVCSAWRVAAVSMTRLWSSITLDLGKERHGNAPLELLSMMLRGKPSPSWSTSRLKLLLERSGTRSLSVFIGSRKDISPHPLLPIILSSTSRWERLHVSLPNIRSFRCFESVAGSLGLLQELQISVSHVDMFPPLWRTTAFRYAPYLHTVIINESPFFFQLPWQQITHADIGGDILAILPDVGWVKSLILHLEKIDRDIVLNSMFTLRHLTTLSMWEGIHGATIVRLLSIMELPSLSSLEIHYAGDEANLPTLRTNSFPLLTSLVISAPSVPIDGTSVCGMLRVLKNLKSFSLATSIKSSYLIATLATHPPKLERLDLAGSQLLFDHTELIHMLRCRWSDQNSVFTEVVLSSLPGPHHGGVEWMPSLNALRQDGLNIVYRP